MRSPGTEDMPGSEEGSPPGNARTPPHSREAASDAAGAGTTVGRARSNDEWVRALGGHGDEQAVALRALREMLLRAILAYLGTHRGSDRGPGSWDDATQLAQDCTQDALLTILKRLETFRGESRFTTWAYQVAIHTLLAELRRQHWKEISLERSAIGKRLPAWPVEDLKSSPERAVQQAQVWTILSRIIEKELTQRQRSVLVAHVFQGMPLEEVANWLGTSRDNIYKIIHDARRKLKKCLIEHGLSQEEILQSFASAE